MIPVAMARKLLGGAMGALSLTAGVARHVAWYVGHQVSGKPRHADDKRRR
jgi:hypothetical protein